MKRLSPGARSVALSVALSNLGLSGLVLLASSCTAQPVVLPSRDFDRPTDITFVCMVTGKPVGAAGSEAGGPDAGVPAGASVASGRPMRECHPRGFVDPVNDNVHHTFAFLPNSSSGLLSVIDADAWTLVNLEPGNPGFNGLPLGVLPSQISASDDGCRLVTANHGSCDLSVVDTAAVLAPALSRDLQSSVASAGSKLVNNVVPHMRNGHALRAFAGEVQFLPMVTTSLTGTANFCSGDPNQTWQALATFPSCDLVTLIDLPTGVIKKAAQVRKTADGKVALVALADDEDPVCPVTDCNDVPTVVADGGADASEADASEGGASTPPPPAPTEMGDVPYVGPAATLAPGPIAIIPESGRAYVGLANAAYVLAFNVSQDKLDLSTGSPIQLYEGALGVNRLRLSIDPYKDKTVGGLPGSGSPSGSFVGDDPSLDATTGEQQFALDRQYLYVIARDGTLRVVQVAHQTESECETNVDFSKIDPATREQERNEACPAVGEFTRRPGATGPGIRLPTPPIDVAVADVRPSPPDQSETSVSGAHAWALTASGAVYLVNIDPVPRAISWVNPDGVVLQCLAPSLTSNDCHPETPTALMPDSTSTDTPSPNTVRDRSFVGYTLALDPSSGPPRLDIPVSQATLGPRLESVWTRGSAANATALTPDYQQTQVYFPDRAAVTPQSWAVTWEGSLMASPRFSGQMLPPTAGSVALQDIGMDFCRLGVQDADIVTLQGCINNNTCGVGKVCVLGSNGAQGAGGLPITGLCLAPSTPPTFDQTECDDLLSTLKRYDVTSTRKSVLTLSPHKDEIVLAAGHPCKPATTPAADGGTLGAAGAGGADGGTDGGASMTPVCTDPSDPSTTKFVCQPDGRCLYPCTMPGETSECRSGRICISYGASSTSCADKQCFCADGPDLRGTATNACLGELLPYTVGVGRGFLVSASQTALPVNQTAAPAPAGVADGDRTCQPIPTADPRDQFRISMAAPTCQNLPAGYTNNMFDSRVDPDLVTMSERPAAEMMAMSLQNILELPVTPSPNACSFEGGPNETDEIGTSPQHVQALFRNRELQLVMTNMDKGPSGVFQIRFDVHGGFQAQTVAIPSDVTVTMPARIVLGPFDANNPVAGTPGAINAEVPYLFVVDQRRLGVEPTRGQLLRIHPRGFAITTPVAGAQPWYEDLANSANLFPIQ